MKLSETCYELPEQFMPRKVYLLCCETHALQALSDKKVNMFLF